MTAISSKAAPPLNLSSISASDVVALKNSSDRDNIGGFRSRLWDKISDFFCGTQRQEAKKILLDLFLPGTIDAHKIQSFFALKDLAGDGYKDHFRHSIEGNKETYTLMLDSDERGVPVLTREIIGTDRQRVSDIVNSDRTAELADQLALDITRGQYAVAGQPLPDNAELDTRTRTQLRLELFDKALDALECNAHEKTAVYALCTQGTASLIMQTAEKKTSPGFPNGLPPQCPVFGDKVSAYSVSREDGVVRVRVNFESDMATIVNDEYRKVSFDQIREGNHIYKSLQISVDFAIDSNGRGDILQLDYFGNKGLDTA